MLFARLSSRKRLLLWFCITAVALPCVYVGSAGALYYYRHNALYQRQAQSHPALSPFAKPTAQTRLLVFSPHCDDDVLGCAGIIRQTIEAGGMVRVVTLTNGDGFRTAVQQHEKKFRVEPKDFIRFAEQRQQESLSALQNLGVSRDNIVFLGYPDRGLLPIWEDYWSPKQPYTSRYTRCQTCPYPNTPHLNTLYCGESVLSDIVEEIENYRPSQIMVTHPADDHGDHAAAAAFVQKAFQHVREQTKNRDWAETTKLDYYLIHRGEWPPNSNTTLLPPPEMAQLETQWKSLPLSAEETTKKQVSLAFHKTQIAMAGGFLTSFVRRNELFGELPSVRIPFLADGSPRANRPFETILLNPVNDNLLRSMQGGGDIKAIYGYRDTKYLHLRLEMRQAVSSRIRYMVRLRPFSAEDRTTPRSLTLSLNATAALSKLGIERRVQEENIELDLPLALLEIQSGVLPKTVAISTNTYLASIEIDKTGIRLMDF